MENAAPRPLVVPGGTEVVTASAKGLTLKLPEPVPAGVLLEMDLMLGARPLHVMGRVVESRGSIAEMEFVAMAQVDRDDLADFLQAVGSGVLRVRPHREE